MKKKKAVFIIFQLLVVSFQLSVYSYADSLGRAEALYLQGSYSESINECAVNISKDSRIRDKAYYLISLSYLKINDTEKAREKLKLITDNFRDSRYFDSAKLAYADSFFLEQNYTRAKELYEALIKSSAKLSSTAYLRLGQCALKSGNWQEVKNYGDTLVQNYPLSLEAALFKELLKNNEFFFTVQVGCFANLENARRLANKLKSENFDSYIDELSLSGNRLYRVRVGKLKSRQEAEAIKEALSKNGYHTRIYP